VSEIACAGQYPRGRCGERGYPAQRPRARRGLPSRDHECGRGGWSLCNCYLYTLY